jgi:hypothetical protein
MSIIQKILKAAFSEKFFQKIKKESQNWIIECKCGYSKSMWEAGGVRFCATPAKKIWGRCPMCKKFGFFRVTKKAQNF